jgi:fatty-acyl-CoA synthase
MFIAELNDPGFDGYDLSSLRTGIMAGSPCPVEVMKQVVNRMGMTEVTICYGMTETSPGSFQTGVEETLERRVATAGRVLPHLEAKVVDGEGRIVPRGQTGEILVRGYAVMRGYWGDAAKTADTIDAAGWLRTGDLGALDDDGYCRISGRLKDLVIRGGENIYPREVEEYLFRHDKIEQVAVFGVPDEKYGEELCAWIKLRTGCAASADEIHDFCRGQIAHYKIPRHIRFVDDFPMTVTGKIQKFMMRDQMAGELNGPHQRGEQD